MSRYDRIRVWKASRPFVQRLCAAPDCGAQFETRCGGCKPACKNQCTNYCSTKCRRRHSAQRRAAVATKNPGFCWFCLGTLRGQSTKFCCKQHSWKYYAAIKWDKPIRLRIEGAVIETRKYTEIDKVKAEWERKLTTLHD